MDANQAKLLAQEFVQVINDKWVFALMQVVVAGVFLTILKLFIENITYYIMLRLNQYIKIGSVIEHKGVKCKIKDITVSAVVLQTKEGTSSLIFVPTKLWRSAQWKVFYCENNERK